MTASIAPDIAASLTDRAKDEQYASLFYHMASSYCRDAGLNNLAEYFAKEAESEQGHLRKLLDYVADWNVVVTDLSPAKQPELPQTLGAILQSAYDMELALGKAYNELRLAIQHTDLFTYDFLAFYTETQTESIIEYNDLLKRYSLSAPLGDLWFDRNFA